MNPIIMECFSKLQQPSVPPLYRAHSHYAMAKFSTGMSSSLKITHCHEALESYKLASNTLGKVNVNRLLMDIEKDKLNKLFMKFVEEAYQVAQYFHHGSFHGLRKAMEFYFLESVDATKYSIVIPVIEFFPNEFQGFSRDTVGESDGLMIVHKKQVHTALRDHYLKLSRSFLENELVFKAI